MSHTFDGTDKILVVFHGKNGNLSINFWNLGSSLDIRLQIMAQLAEVVEHIEEDFPFSILKDLNHNGIEMNPCLVLINESFLNQGINTDDRNKIKLILCPEINSESNNHEGGIGDPRYRLNDPNNQSWTVQISRMNYTVYRGNLYTV